MSTYSQKSHSIHSCFFPLREGEILLDDYLGCNKPSQKGKIPPGLPLQSMLTELASCRSLVQAIENSFCEAEGFLVGDRSLLGSLSFLQRRLNLFSQIFLHAIRCYNSKPYNDVLHNYSGPAVAIETTVQTIEQSFDSFQEGEMLPLGALYGATVDCIGVLDCLIYDVKNYGDEIGVDSIIVSRIGAVAVQLGTMEKVMEYPTNHLYELQYKPFQKVSI